MQIGEVIRKYRREKNMTQEEMAGLLGVTAPAVNKWENGNSMPDIMLLAPIARLLGITPDILLSFREELSQEEIDRMIKEADARLQNSTWEEVFLWAKKIMEEYPNCEELILNLAEVLEAFRLMQDIPDTGEYEKFTEDCYKRALESKKESLRYRSADALFHFYMRKEHYEEAEAYLHFFSEQNPERKRKQAFLYSKTGRLQEAYKAYEEILFSGYQMAAVVFYGLFGLSMQEKDMEKADMFLEKHKGLAELFEMGTYQANSCRLELAVVQKDEEKTLEIMERLLEGVEELTAFAKSPLYAHMSLREPGEEFKAKVKQNLLESFRDEETYGFLKENKRYQNLVK
ncbi:MAG: helix-turn-helix transcriptional regulator [Lachnospiraceae bacterium]|nr:helix-turn-helix transcriptional regulator [Lachnospiraceae bacterium]